MAKETPKTVDRDLERFGEYINGTLSSFPEIEMIEVPDEE